MFPPSNGQENLFRYDAHSASAGVSGRRCRAMWHPRQSARRFSGASVPPATTGTTWSHSSIPDFPQRVQRQPWTRSRILSRNRFHAARAVRLIRSWTGRCASVAGIGGRARRPPAPRQPLDRRADGARTNRGQGEGWPTNRARPPLPPVLTERTCTASGSTARLPSSASCRSAPMSCVDWLQTGRRGMHRSAWWSPAVRAA